MKKIALILIVSLCMSIAGGCGNTEKVDSMLEAQNSVSGDSSQENSAVKGDSTASDREVDLDLTKMDGTMVYSTVYDMVSNPDSYIGKTVRVKGNFTSSYDETTKTNYFFVLVGDATACCSQGLEFIWDDNSHTYPGEYPADNAEIQICGTFGQYDENGNKFYYVAADEMTVI